MLGPVQHHGHYLLRVAFVAAVLLVATRGNPYQRRRNKAYRWQRITPDGEPLSPEVGGARGGNRSIVV